MLECMVLLPLYGNNVCMFSSKHFSFYVCMFTGLVSRIDNSMVASSSLVGGSGTSQCGIRAHVAAWASMGREEAVTEAGFPLPSRRNEKIRENDKKSFKKIQSMKIIRWLRLKSIRYIG